jgi:hypothetical protein
MRIRLPSHEPITRHGNDRAYSIDFEDFVYSKSRSDWIFAQLGIFMKKMALMPHICAMTLRLLIPRPRNA